MFPRTIWRTRICRPFAPTIVDGHADSIMCAYNSIDGAPACVNTMLLQKTLRDDWKFNGYVVSDCGAIGDVSEGHKFAPSIEQASVDAVRAGTDLSCGDEYATLVKAVHDGLIKESEIDAAVKRLMTARIRMGILAPMADQPMQSLNRSVVFAPTHARLDLQAADESMVLLKNDGALPFGANIKTIAVIGPNATSMAALKAITTERRSILKPRWRHSKRWQRKIVSACTGCARRALRGAIIVAGSAGCLPYGGWRGRPDRNGVSEY